jgi:hypothetical protein
MFNPWLTLPLDDYEGHMNSPEVQQLGVLSELFREVLAARLPASVAILGVAGGNGLEHIDSATTKRVIGLDVNPDYLEAVHRRYRRLAGLELVCTDLAARRVRLKPVDLVHAALIFEHAGLDRCLENAVSLVSDLGALSVVLQLPSTTQAEIAQSGFPAIQRLASHFSLIHPAVLCQKLTAGKFRLTSESTTSLPTGKTLWLAVFVPE